MKPSVRLRLMTAADVPFADSLRDVAGWNQTPADWRRFLALEPDGCFVAEHAGRPAGTATTLTYGRELAWIGMVLVHPDARRHGLATALLEHCVRHLRGLGITCLKLDATPLGQTVYDRLGFQPEWTLTRWLRSQTKGEEPVPPQAATDPRLRAWQPDDLDHVQELDRPAFGTDRQRVLDLLTLQNHSALVYEDDLGKVAGYAMLRPGARAWYLGPVVARAAEAATPLIATMLAQTEGQPTIWDIPNSQHVATAWAQSHGFTPQRQLTRMFLGVNVQTILAHQFAIAGPEIG